GLQLAIYDLKRACVIRNVLEYVKHCYSVVGFFLDLRRKLIDRRLKYWHRAPCRCQPAQCIIGFDAFKPSIRWVNFEKIVARSGTNFQDSWLLRPLQTDKQIPQHSPACPKPPMLALEQCVLASITLLH